MEIVAIFYMQKLKTTSSNKKLFKNAVCPSQAFLLWVKNLIYQTYTTPVPIRTWLTGIFSLHSIQWVYPITVLHSQNNLDDCQHSDDFLSLNNFLVFQWISMISNDIFSLIHWSLLYTYSNRSLTTEQIVITNLHCPNLKRGYCDC